MEYEIADDIIHCCSRCKYRTGSEEAIRTHILGKTCPKDAQYYIERKA